MTKQFSELAVGDKFKWVDGEIYTKIEQEQISCCTYNSAVNDQGGKIQVEPIKDVEVLE